MSNSSVDTQEKLSRTTILLHWIVAFAVIALTAVGFYMSEFEEWSLYPIHKSIGVLVFFVILYRVVWRIKNGWLVPVRDYPTFEFVLSKITHWILILGTLIMPISGFIFSGAGGHGVGVFGFVLVPKNPDPIIPDKDIAFNADVSHFAHEVHEIVGLLLAAAIVLHIVGSIKHHVIDKDRTLLRMKGQ